MFVYGVWYGVWCYVYVVVVLVVCGYLLIVCDLFVYGIYVCFFVLYFVWLFD